LARAHVESGLSLGRSQSTDYPLIGAQVFIEPGQPGEQIEKWVSTLEQNDLKVCRIRMFENHMKQPDGIWDFSLYDKAFEAAEKHGVCIFATLFPEGGDDVGGFNRDSTFAQV